MMKTPTQALRIALQANNLPAISGIIEQHLNDLDILSGMHSVLTAYIGLLQDESEGYAHESSRVGILSESYIKNVAQIQKQIVQLHDIASQVMARIHDLSEAKLIIENTVMDHTNGMSP
jgi:hypothetical protein